MTGEMYGAWDRLGQEHVFVTGRAGTGKSTLLREFCAAADRRVVKVAPTGVAALNIGGSTIHSFFGFKPGIQPREASLVEPRKPEVYQALECLVIDEVSMVSAGLLDCIDSFLREHGPHPREPFGGVALACFGDPFQLPPVPPRAEAALSLSYENPFFFMARSYKGIPTVELTKAFRQTDGEFLGVLDKIREGSAVAEDLELFQDRVESGISLDYIRDTDATMLTTHRAESDRINDTILRTLPGQTYSFRARTAGYFKGRTPTTEELSLKVGTKVMLLVNNPPHWVNGTVCTVTRIYPGHGGGIAVELPNGSEKFVEPYTWEQYQYEVAPNGEIYQVAVGEFTQLPARLAWSVTIHKSQGLTLDRAIVHLGREVFAEGQLYVALSRVRTLAGLTLTPRSVRKSDILVDQAVSRFMREGKEATP
jgi:ATP-dependent DNA helicase PIF1